MKGNIYNNKYINSNVFFLKKNLISIYFLKKIKTKKHNIFFFKKKLIVLKYFFLFIFFKNNFNFLLYSFYKYLVNNIKINFFLKKINYFFFFKSKKIKKKVKIEK
jgi:hypothetical protein